MKLSEKELEDIVFESSNQALQEKGLEIFGRKIRQLKSIFRSRKIDEFFLIKYPFRGRRKLIN